MYRFIITAGELVDYLGYRGRGPVREHRQVQQVLAEMEEGMGPASVVDLLTR